MNEFSQQIIRRTAIAALISMVAGVAGLLGQVMTVALGGVEQPLLIGAFTSLATGGLAALVGLAGLVWRAEQNGK